MFDSLISVRIEADVIKLLRELADSLENKKAWCRSIESQGTELGGMRIALELLPRSESRIAPERKDQLGPG